MKCPRCHSLLIGESRDGEPMIRTRAIVLKAGGLLLVCPHCKCDVQPSATVMKAMQQAAIVFFHAGEVPPKKS